MRATPPPIHPAHVAWFKKTINLLSIPGVWAVPRTMLTVQRSEKDLVEIRPMEGVNLSELSPEWADDPEYWEEARAFDAFQIARHCELAGFRVINHLADQKEKPPHE